jgi:hypothetical protein
MKLQVINTLEVFSYFGTFFTGKLVPVQDERRNVTREGLHVCEALSLVIVEEEHKQKGKLILRIPCGHVFSVNYASQVVTGVAVQFHKLPLIDLQRSVSRNRNSLRELFPLEAFHPGVLNENRPMILPHDDSIVLLSNKTHEEEEPEGTFDLEITILNLQFEVTWLLVVLVALAASILSHHTSSTELPVRRLFSA